MRTIKIKGIVWEQQEAGWWCADCGCVCQRGLHKGGNNWWYYPIGTKSEYGPYKTMRKAMKAVETITEQL